MVCNVTDTFVREGIGHGAIATHFDAKIVHASNVDLNCDDDALSTIYNRVVAIEGPLANLTTGAIVVALS